MKKRSRRILLLLLTAGCMLAVWVVWNAAASVLADSLVVDERLEKADAIFVLSGSADHIQRAADAASAYEDGVASRVFLTDDHQRGGWDDKEAGNPFFVDRSISMLVKHGVPRESIEVLPGYVSNTHNEATLIIAESVRREFRSIQVITSRFHSRRANWVLGIEVQKQQAPLTVAVRSAPSVPGYPTSGNWWLSIRGWRSVAGEYVKFAFYSVYYRS